MDRQSHRATALERMVGRGYPSGKRGGPPRGVLEPWGCIILRRFASPSGVNLVIQLASFDSGVSTTDREAYVKEVEAVTRLPFGSVRAGNDRLAFRPHAPDARQPMSVSSVQEGLKAIGFFPGGKVDGICGYRTLSAIRLFQEYVRSVEKLPCVPDGLFGPSSQEHLTRWLDHGAGTTWAPAIEAWRTGTLGQSEYTRWLALLEGVKARSLANPDRMLQMVNAFDGATDTRKAARWDFTPAGNIHLVGIRRSEASGRFDDTIVISTTCSCSTWACSTKCLSATGVL